VAELFQTPKGQEDILKGKADQNPVGEVAYKRLWNRVDAQYTIEPNRDTNCHPEQKSDSVRGMHQTQCKKQLGESLLSSDLCSEALAAQFVSISNQIQM
jgi:hypothetical protein